MESGEKRVYDGEYPTPSKKARQTEHQQSHPMPAYIQPVIKKEYVCIRCGAHHHIRECPHPRNIQCENCHGNHHMRRCPHLTPIIKSPTMCTQYPHCKYGSQCYYTHPDGKQTVPPYKSVPQTSLYKISQ